MANEYKQKLNDLIIGSELSTEQKLLWDLFLKLSYDEEDEAVYEALTEDDESLPLLTKFLRDKIMHMKEANNEAWRKIIQNEVKYAQLLA